MLIQTHGEDLSVHLYLFDGHPTLCPDVAFVAFVACLVW